MTKAQAGRLGALALNARLTPEQRSESGRRAIMSITPEQRRARARRAAIIGNFKRFGTPLPKDFKA